MDGRLLLPLLLLIPSYRSLFTHPGTAFGLLAVTSAGPPPTHVVCITWRSRRWSLDLIFSLLLSSAHPTIERPLQPQKGGNNPYPRRTEQSTAGVHRPHMHLVIWAPLFIHHLGQYSGSVLALHRLLAFVCVPCVCLYFSGPYKACLPWASSCACVCVCVTDIRKMFFWKLQLYFQGLRPADWQGVHTLYVWVQSARNCVCHD